MMQISNGVSVCLSPHYYRTVLDGEATRYEEAHSNAQPEAIGFHLTGRGVLICISYIISEAAWKEVDMSVILN